MIRGFGKSFKKAGKLADILWQEVTVKRPHMAYVGWWSDTPNLGDKAPDALLGFPLNCLGLSNTGF